MRVRFYSSDELIADFMIQDAPWTIGRDEECNICLADASVSWHHAMITLINGQVIIEDMGSTNGTMVNDERIACATILSGRASLDFGTFKCVAVIDDACLGNSERTQKSSRVNITLSAASFRSMPAPSGTVINDMGGDAILRRFSIAKEALDRQRKLTFMCKHCGAEFPLSTALLGRAVQCPTCRKNLSVPTQSLAELQSRSESCASELKLQFGCPYCFLQVWASSDVFGRIGMCPHCYHEIRIPLTNSESSSLGSRAEEGFLEKRKAGAIYEHECYTCGTIQNVVEPDRGGFAPICRWCNHGMGLGALNRTNGVTVLPPYCICCGQTPIKMITLHQTTLRGSTYGAPGGSIGYFEQDFPFCNQCNKHRKALFKSVGKQLTPACCELDGTFVIGRVRNLRYRSLLVSLELKKCTSRIGFRRLSYTYGVVFNVAGSPNEGIPLTGDQYKEYEKTHWSDSDRDSWLWKVFGNYNEYAALMREWRIGSIEQQRTAAENDAALRAQLEYLDKIANGQTQKKSWWSGKPK